MSSSGARSSSLSELPTDAAALRAKCEDLQEEVHDLRDQLKRAKARAGGGLDASTIELIELKGTFWLVFVVDSAQSSLA